MQRKLAQVPQLHVEARIQPATFNVEKRTVDVCWTTGAAGQRFDWSTWAPYMEELQVDERAVRLGRLQDGAPVLDSHQSRGLSSTIGVVEKAWIEGGKGYARLRFSERPEVQGIVGDIEKGIIRNVSVGYIVHRYQDVTTPDAKMKTLRAVDWEPAEISFVAVPFDAGAQVRAAEKDTSKMPVLFEAEIIENARAASQTHREHAMEGNQNPQGGATQVDLEKVKREAAEAAAASERARVAGILETTRKLGLAEKVGTDAIASGIALDAFRAAAIDAKVDADKAAATVGQQGAVEVTRDESETRAKGVENALLHRAFGARVTLAEGRDYRGLSLIELARDHLTRAGVNVRGMAPAQIATEALRTRTMHSTSDFPYILANVATKSLLMGYEALEQNATFKPFVREKFVKDFKTVQRTRLGELSTLAKVVQGAEVTMATLGEAKEEYALATYGRRVAITRETIVNDDLDAFSDIPMKLGAAAARMEADVVYGILTANANMGDGVALFHANHNNIGTGGAISVTTIGEARKLMRKQKGINSRAALNITPKFLVVPAAIETVADQFVSTALLASQTSNVNPFAGRLQVISEARLDDSSATMFYLIADPATGVDTIEVAYLEGQSGPVTETRAGFEVNGVEVKITHDFAAKAIDWRGMVRNAGA
jgi:hypothetical protein